MEERRKTRNNREAGNKIKERENLSYKLWRKIIERKGVRIKKKVKEETTEESEKSVRDKHLTE